MSFVLWNPGFNVATVGCIHPMSASSLEAAAYVYVLEMFQLKQKLHGVI